jgi:hypothetical protein
MPEPLHARDRKRVHQNLMRTTPNAHRVFAPSQIATEPQWLVADPVTCVAPPYEPLRVRRLPGVAATTSKPRNPLEDAHPPCITAKGDLTTRVETGARDPTRSSPQYAPPSH